MLRPKIFNDQAELIVAIADRGDGNFGILAASSNKEQWRARAEVWQKLGISPEQVVTLKPRGSRVQVINQPQKFIIAQGLITNQPDLYLSLLTADCPAMVIYDTRQKVIGLLHLGWWQVYRYLLKDFWLVWQSKYQSQPADLKIFIGPSICGQCYQLTGWRGWLRVAMFKLSSWRVGLVKQNNHYYLDLRQIILQQLKSLGLAQAEIKVCEHCTYENKQLPSRRREGIERASSLLTVAGNKSAPTFKPALAIVSQEQLSS